MFIRQKSFYRTMVYALLLFLLAFPAQSVIAVQGVTHSFVGDGSVESPYLIMTVEDLYMLREVYSSYEGKVFLQVADIDLSGTSWTPIGDSDTPFQAVYDGGGYNINGLKIDMPEGRNVGLFGVIGESGVVKNVNLVGGLIIGKVYVGGLAGQNLGLISNSYSQVNIIGRSDIGGLAGLNDGEITDVSVFASIQAQSLNIGGLIGRNNGWVQNGHVTGNNSVTCITYGDDCDVESESGYVGGLVGTNSGYVRDSSSSASVKGSSTVGGLAGSSYHSIIGSYASGDVRSDGGLTGGLVGNNQYGIIYHSHATGNVHSTMDDRIGGLVGEQLGGEIAFSYATGNVEGKQDVGGLVGMSYEDSKISRSHATGDVNGTFNVGGLVGTNIGEVEYSYATGNVQSSNTVAGGLIGRHEGSVRNSYATGNVIGNFAGGLIGSTTQSTTILVEHTYSSGQVLTDENGGGFIGLLSGGTFISSYWDMGLSGYETSVGLNSSGTNVDEDIIGLFDMTDPDSFEGWDFVQTWEIVAGNVGPTLRAFTDRTDLEDVIYEAEIILSGIMIGNRPGEYPKASVDYFNEQILIARQVLNDSGSSQKQLDDAVLDLRKAIDTFYASIHPVKLIFAETVENDRFVRLYFNAKIEGFLDYMGAEGFYISDPNVSIDGVGFNAHEGTIELALSDPLQSIGVEVTVWGGTVYFNGSLVENDSTVRVMTQLAVEQLQKDLRFEGQNEITLENIVRYMFERNEDVNGDGNIDAADVQALMRFLSPHVIHDINFY